MRILVSAIITGFLASLYAQSQPCSTQNPPRFITLSGNRILAPISSTLSDFYWPDNVQGDHRVFRVPENNGLPSVLFSQSLWLGGLTLEGEYLACGETFGNFASNNSYYHGPLNSNGSPFADNCTDFNRVWQVYGPEIKNHIDDFADNGVIDNPLVNILGWPGSGNQNFESVYGFQLPESGELAPFKDIDGDGIYEPLSGEYPIEPNGQKIPQHMSWNITNTYKDLVSSSSSNLIVAEVQTTYWSFYCTGNDLLNNSIFSRHEIINKGIDTIRGFRAGIWSSPDLGCLYDDYVGCDTTNHSFFAYNNDNNDDADCFNDDNGAFGQNPPAQAISFLNKPLESFISHFIPNDGPPVFIIPESAFGIYQALIGKWADSSPIQIGGDGYDEGNAPDTEFLFHGNPTIPGEWSQYEVQGGATLVSGRSLLGATSFGTWTPGDRATLDVAYSFHRAPNRDFLGNVELMYEQVADIQSIYDNNFDITCEPLSCVDDCVWPGDLNNDGIANHVDLVAYGFGQDDSGTQRDGPIFWDGFTATDWPTNQIFVENQNAKHLDANGDAEVSPLDFEITTNMYGSTHSEYEAPSVFLQGFDLQLQNESGQTEFLLESGCENLRLSAISDYPNLKALAFTIEKDEGPIRFNGPYDSFGSQNSDALHYTHIIDELDHAVFLPDGTLQQNLITPILDFKICRVSLPAATDFPDFVSMRIKNATGWLSDGTEVSLGSQNLTIFLEEPSSAKHVAIPEPLLVFPNPVQHRLNFSLPADFTIQYLQIIDQFGRTVLEMDQWGNSIYVAHLSPGTYHLVIHSDEQVLRSAFVKE